jgi:hypothetical protein
MDSSGLKAKSYNSCVLVGHKWRKLFHIVNSEKVVAIYRCDLCGQDKKMVWDGEGRVQITFEG